MTKLEKYYNSFKEDHRLTTRHGIVEFTVSMKYIHDYLPKDFNAKILDVGAGTGRYSVSLSKEGYSVTAVEPVLHNLQILESKHANVNCWNGDARNLHFLDDKTFDLTLLFGPMYHLTKEEDMLQAFNEARRVTKDGGIIMVSYLMNEYSIITYGFKTGHIKEVMEQGAITEDFHTIATEDSLYTYLRLEDIDRLAELSDLKRQKIIAVDGAADYMRKELNAMDEETFNLFIKYQLSICERKELLGASSHLVDILKN